MSLKIVQHNNFWAFSDLSSFFVIIEFSLLRQSFLCCERVCSVRQKTLSQQSFLCCDSFSVATKNFVETEFSLLR